MKKFFTLVVLLCTVIIFSTTAQAKTYVESTKEYASIGVKRDHNLFVDIQKNPSKYIALGGAGTGLSLYMDRESIDVQQYEPPIYLISFRKIYYSVKTDETVAVGSEIERYKYNYEERKMYFEHRYYDGKIEWDLIDTKKSGTSGLRSMISAGVPTFFKCP